jgi:hypothetical protein
VSIRGAGDLWVVENLISYARRPWQPTVNILEFRGEEVVRESIYITETREAPDWRAPWRAENSADGWRWMRLRGREVQTHQDVALLLLAEHEDVLAELFVPAVAVERDGLGVVFPNAEPQVGKPSLPGLLGREVE